MKTLFQSSAKLRLVCTASLLSLTLAACETNGQFTALERTLPPTPEYVKEVPEPPRPKQGDYAAAVIKDYRNRLRKSNAVIRNFRKWYEDTRSQYSGKGVE